MESEDLPRTVGNYRLLAVLGRGGSGVVYRAEQPALGRPVAIKFLHGAFLGADDDSLARFRREAEVTARLAHPGIVAVHDFGEAEGSPYLVMELVEGLPLDRHVETHRSSLQEKLSILARAARALHHAHANGIVHRDVKPGNILVDASGNPKLTDFGLAKVQESRLTLSGGLLGTPLYMSPEQASGGAAHVDARTDVYSLGVVLYELVTGAPPFSGNTVGAILDLILRHDPIPPRVLAPGLPRDVETVCLKAMEREPDRRYRTAMEFAEDLERCAKGEPVLARPLGRAGRALRWIRRRRAAVAAAAGVLLVAAVAGAVLIVRGARERAREAQEEAGRKGEEAYDAGRCAEAADLLSRIRGTSADLPRRRLRRAAALRDAGRLGESEKEFADFIRDFPNDAAARRHRGLLALDVGDLATAVSSYREAARLLDLPDRAVLERRADWDVLISLVERRSEGRPHLANYHLGFLRKFSAPKGDPRSILPEPLDPYRLESSWYADFGGIAAQETREIDALLEKHGPHPVLHHWRAWLLRDRPAEAIGDLDRAVRLLPIARWLRLERAVCLRNLGRGEDAEAEWKAALVLAPRDSYLRHWMAWEFRRDREFARAARLLKETARDQQTGDVPIVHHASELFAEAAECAALAGNESELLRHLRDWKETDRGLRRATIERAPEFQEMLARPQVREFLESLPP